MKEYENINCDLCNLNNYKIWGKNLVKCKNCGLIYQNPRPTEKALEQFYNHTYVDERLETKKKNLDREKMYKIEVKYLINFLSNLPLLSKKKKIKFLDVGCGNGHFLRSLPDDIDKYGVEYTEDAANTASSYATKVWKGEVYNVNFENEKFDIVQLRGTLEHVRKPTEVLKAAHSLLNPGGILILSALPNVSSLPARLFKSRWRLVLEDEHIYHFNLKTINKYFNKIGFKTRKVWRPYFNTPYGHIIKDSFILFKNFFLRRKSPPFYGAVLNIYAFKKMEKNDKN